LATLTFWLPRLDAQQPAADEFSIPGQPENAPALSSPTPGPSSAEGEPQPKEYANKLQMLLEIGGWTMYPLIGLSIAWLGLTAYCLLDLKKGKFFPDKVVNGLQEDMDRADVLAALERAKNSPTCLGQVMYGATEYIGDRGYQVLDDAGLYDSMADAAQEFNRGRAQIINYFCLIAQAAPMLGLLGTVSGMIKAFGSLGLKGIEGPNLSSNISEALWTTAAGLIIALPALFTYFTFKDRLIHLVAVTDRHAIRLLNSLRRAIIARTHGTAEPEPAHHA